MTGPYPKFQNDAGVAEISIGAREFHCIGETPPQDHPHIYLNMGDRDDILCPYCATLYHFDARLAPATCDPPEALCRAPIAPPENT